MRNAIKLWMFLVPVPNGVPVKHSVTANTVVITFGQLQGHAQKYVVQCQREGSSCWNQDYPVTTPQAVVRNLRPYTEYTFTVRTVAGSKQKTQTFLAKTSPAGQYCIIRYCNISFGRILKHVTLTCFGVLEYK